MQLYWLYVGKVLAYVTFYWLYIGKVSLCYILLVVRWQSLSLCYILLVVRWQSLRLCYIFSLDFFFRPPSVKTDKAWLTAFSFVYGLL